MGLTEKQLREYERYSLGYDVPSPRIIRKVPIWTLAGKCRNGGPVIACQRDFKATPDIRSKAMEQEAYRLGYSKRDFTAIQTASLSSGASLPNSLVCHKGAKRYYPRTVKERKSGPGKPCNEVRGFWKGFTEIGKQTTI